MDSFLEEQFLGELNIQCQFATIALGDLQASLEPKADKDVLARAWYSIQGFFVAVGNISKMLWPSEKAKKAKIYEARGRHLRKLVTIQVNNL